LYGRQCFILFFIVIDTGIQSARVNERKLEGYLLQEKNEKNLSHVTWTFSRSKQNILHLLRSELFWPHDTEHDQGFTSLFLQA